MVTGSWPDLATVSPRITSLVSDTVPSGPTTCRWLTTVEREKDEDTAVASSRGFFRMPRRAESVRESPLLAMLSCFSMRDLSAEDDDDLESSASFFLVELSVATSLPVPFWAASNENLGASVGGDSWIEVVDRKESVLSRTADASLSAMATASRPSCSSWMKLSRSLARGFWRGVAGWDTAELSRACCSCRWTRSRRGGELGPFTPLVTLEAVLEVVELLLILRARRPPNRGRPDESQMSEVRVVELVDDVLVDSTVASASDSVRFVLVRRSALRPNKGRPRSSVGPTP